MRAGDFPIMSHEIQGMALGMVTYELLLLAHDAVMAIISDKSAGLPTVRQHAQKALTWLVAIATGAQQLEQPADAEKIGKRLDAQVKKASLWRDDPAAAAKLAHVYRGYDPLGSEDAKAAALPATAMRSPDLTGARIAPSQLTVATALASAPDMLDCLEPPAYTTRLVQLIGMDAVSFVQETALAERIRVKEEIADLLRCGGLEPHEVEGHATFPGDGSWYLQKVLDVPEPVGPYIAMLGLTMHTIASSKSLCTAREREQESQQHLRDAEEIDRLRVVLRERDQEAVCVAAGKDVPGRVLGSGVDSEVQSLRARVREVEASLASERATVASLQGQITGHKWFIDRYMDQWFMESSDGTSHGSPGSVSGTVVAT